MFPSAYGAAGIIGPLARDDIINVALGSIAEGEVRAVFAIKRIGGVMIIPDGAGGAVFTVAENGPGAVVAAHFIGAVALIGDGAA